MARWHIIHGYKNVNPTYSLDATNEEHTLRRELVKLDIVLMRAGLFSRRGPLVP